MDDGRLKALKVSLGEAVPKHLVLELLSHSSPPIVPEREFLSHFSRLLEVFGNRRLSTALLNPETVCLLVSLYAKPPRLAFVLLDVGRSFKVEVATPKGRYELYRDGLSSLLGPGIRFTPRRLGRNLFGDYVPIAGEHLALCKRLEGYDPKYVAEGRRSWFVYEAQINPVPVNVAHLLQLLRA